MTIIDQEMVDCWRINYGLDKSTPAEAARWWSENGAGQAPAGAVAALGLALNERDALIADAHRYRWLRDPNNMRAREIVRYYGDVEAGELDAAIDAAMKAQADGN